MKTQSVNRVVATLFSIIFPGSGQFANGQWAKGFLALLLVFASLYLPVVMYDAFPFPYILVWLWCLIDAYRVAKRRDQRGEAVRWVYLLLGGFLSLVLFVVFAGFAVFAIFGKSDSTKSEINQTAEQQLQEWYQEEFTVTQNEYSWNLGKYQMRATPKDHPDLSLFVRVTEDGTKIEDDYLDQLWSQQSMTRMDSLIKQTFGVDYLVHLMARPDQDFKTELNNKQEVPTYQNMVNDHPESFSQDIRVYLFGSYKASMEKQTLEQSLQVLQQFSAKEKEELAVTIYWLDPSVKELLEKQTGAAMYDYKLTHTDPKPLFELNVWRGRVPGVVKVEDLNEYIWSK